MLNSGIGVYAAVAQKRPVAADFFDAIKIHLGQDERFVFGCLGDDNTERITHK